MTDKKFIYKPGAVDQLIIGIVLLASLAFGALIYFDATAEPTGSASPQVQNLREEKLRLEAELERIQNENNPIDVEVQNVRVN